MALCASGVTLDAWGGTGGTLGASGELVGHWMLTLALFAPLASQLWIRMIRLSKEGMVICLCLIKLDCKSLGTS
jgi:hypothetical protein